MINERCNEMLKLRDFRREINRILNRNQEIIQDLDDWWIFCLKYEKMKLNNELSSTTSSAKGRACLKNNLKNTLQLDDLEKKFFSELYHKGSRYIPDDIVDELETCLLAYLNFKRRQEAEKLLKVKESQLNLPVYQFKDEIINSVKNERVIIIAGDTGCGKSTQVPQYLLEAGFERIVCTQPRRIACISLCKRVSYETLNKYGDLIGYQIRFEKRCKNNTKILFVTDGILLRQVINDGTLSRYDTVILDEVHERHIQGDFLLGILKCLLFQRKNLKLVLMSATINSNLFSEYFGGNAKLISVPGRLFPIQLHYNPPMVNDDSDKSKKDSICPAPYIRILQTIDEKFPCTERGDVLIFVSGISEITTIIEAVLKYNEKSKKWIVLPLHSSLALADQDKVFDYPPDGFRKCIVSTNIAETSVTIDGVRFVIDSGMVKEMNYDATCKIQRLKEFWVSKASADQRKGRAGRTGPGICYRLYSESDFEAMQDYATPEIKRVPLDSVLLQMIFMGLPDVRKFPFLEAPNEDLIENAIILLKRHNAVYENEKLTPMGHLLSKLPVDICLGKVLVNGSIFDQIEPALSLASALSVQSPYTHYAFKDLSCETARQSCESGHGDPITLLNALREWLEIKQTSLLAIASTSQSSRQWAKARGFEEARFYDMTKLRSQFRLLLEEAKMLEETYEESFTSAERIFRKGETKLLRDMKRKYCQNEEIQKRKMLKPSSWEIQDSADEGPDIRDINFRLLNDSSKLSSLLSGSSTTTYKDIVMLKIILLSGLYPQVAVPDEFNHCKGVNEQLFHTKDKPFVFLHPQSYFGIHPEIVQLQEKDIVHVPGFNKRNPLSSKHQLLCYLSLLETNKPYLVNTMRMPLAQSLLLVSNELQTNSNFTHVICDSWIRLIFVSAEAAEKLMQQVIKLRNLWQNLLKLKMKGEKCSSSRLADRLVQLMNSEVVCSYKRLLPADLKNCFNGFSSLVFEDDKNPFHEDFKMVPSQYGGLQVTPYLIYNCLTYMGTCIEFTCPACLLTAPFNVLERLQHQMKCSPHLFSKDDNNVSASESSKKLSLKKFNCPTCHETLLLTSIEILRHEKKHVTA